jgi:hypothetical protein
MKRDIVTLSFSESRLHRSILALSRACGTAPHGAQPPGRRGQTGPRQQNLNDILTFYQAESRLPVSGRSRREATMAEWPTRRRKDARRLHPLPRLYATALDAIPPLTALPGLSAADAVRWKQRLARVVGYLGGCSGKYGSSALWAAHSAHPPRGRETDRSEGSQREQVHPTRAARPPPRGNE